MPLQNRKLSTHGNVPFRQSFLSDKPLRETMIDDGCAVAIRYAITPLDDASVARTAGHEHASRTEQEACRDETETGDRSTVFFLLSIGLSDHGDALPHTHTHALCVFRQVYALYVHIFVFVCVHLSVSIGTAHSRVLPTMTTSGQSPTRRLLACL